MRNANDVAWGNFLGELIAICFVAGVIVIAVYVTHLAECKKEKRAVLENRAAVTNVINKQVKEE